MYTSYIGKKFLKLYNKRKGTNLSAERFFREIQFPIFFDSDKHLMHVHGSTFFQSISLEKIKESDTEPLARLKRLQEDILNGKVSGSTYVGYAAGEVTAVTSGQVTSMNYEISSEEIYLSWIGQGFAIGLKGGLVFIDDEKIFWHLFKGWNVYRKHHDQTPNLKPRQIETWNGQWLFFCSRFKMPELVYEDSFQIEIDSAEKEGGIKSIATMQWAKIIFALTRMFGNKTLISHAFISSKTNSTFGFVNIYLKEIHRIYEVRNSLFFDGKYILKEEEIESLVTFYGFREVCRIGTIGLKAIEPAQLREYMPKSSFKYSQGKDFVFSNEESFKNYQLIKIWIIAMLNKTELLKFATEVAVGLIEIEKLDERGKKVFFTLSQEIRESGNVKLFIDKLTQILIHQNEKADVYRNVVEEVLKMPSDVFPLFLTLIRFEYAYKKNKN